jgi:hypothetical protein
VTPERARLLLGVRIGAPREEVDRVFRDLARAHHPDRGGNPGRFAEIVAARDALLRPRAAPRAQVIVIQTRGWRRAVRVVQRWRFRMRQARPGVRVR